MEFFPVAIPEGQEVTRKEEAMACRALPLICSVRHQPRLCHPASPWLQRSCAAAHSSVVAYWGAGSPKHSPLLMCGVVWGPFVHIQVMDLSSVLFPAKSLIALLCKYCKTLCFSCLIFFLAFVFNRIDLLRSKIYLHIEPRHHKSIQGTKQISTPINVLT